MICGIMRDLKTDTNNPWNGLYPWTAGNLKKVFEAGIDPISSTAQQKVSSSSILDMDTWLIPFEKPFFQLFDSKIIAVETPDADSFYQDVNGNSQNGMDESVDIPIRKISIDEPLKIDMLPKKSFERISSVMTRPEPKSFQLNKTNLDAEEDGLNISPTADQESAQKAPKKKKSKKNKKEKKPNNALALDNLTISDAGYLKYVLWQNTEYTMECFWTDQPLDLPTRLKFKLELILTVKSRSDHRYCPFNIESSDDAVSIHCLDIRCKLDLKLVRSTILEPFVGKFQGIMIVNETHFEIQFVLPFSINILLPSQIKLAAMTPPKFMELLKNPPGGAFASMGTTTLLPPLSLETTNAIDKIAIQISCVVVERHPGAVSLFGFTSFGVPIAGLVKERRNKAGRVCLAIDIKTGHTTVLDWVMETLSELSSDWLE